MRKKLLLDFDKVNEKLTQLSGMYKHITVIYSYMFIYIRCDEDVILIFFNRKGSFS